MADHQSSPEPRTEGDNIPWSDPDFSEEMLEHHLSQEHDGASRRFEIIDRQVEWIDSVVLSKHPARVLDLGCGPGLYLQRLALLGHDCVGIDYSPASIAYARDQAAQAGLRIRYVLEDMREAKYGSGFDLIMLTYGEFNVFSPPDARLLLRKCWAALTDRGTFLLEASTFDHIYERTLKPPRRSTSESGINVHESFWDASCRAATDRDTFTDEVSGRTTVEAVSYQAYTDQEYEDLLGQCGFRIVTEHLSLTGQVEDWSRDLTVFVALKQGGQR